MPEFLHLIHVKLAQVHRVLGTAQSFGNVKANVANQLALFANPLEGSVVFEHAGSRSLGEYQFRRVADDLLFLAVDDARLWDVGNVDSGSKACGGQLHRLLMAVSITQ